MINQSHNTYGSTQKPAWKILRPWHRICAGFLGWKIRRQHRELAQYVRRSAYEISAWKQDISFLDLEMERHLTLAGFSQPIAPNDDNIVSLEESAQTTPVPSLVMVQ